MDRAKEIFIEVADQICHVIGMGGLSQDQAEIDRHFDKIMADMPQDVITDFEKNPDENEKKLRWNFEGIILNKYVF